MKFLILIISFLLYSLVLQSSTLTDNAKGITLQLLKKDIEEPTFFTSFSEDETISFDKFKKEFTIIQLKKSIDRGVGIPLGVVTVATGTGLIIVDVVGLSLIAGPLKPDSEKGIVRIIAGGLVIGAVGVGLIYLGKQIIENAEPRKKKKSSKQKQLDSIKKFEGY
tara:strand:- start:4136 stop:4630 length:495 start_codon:yes stop_codon:yes gene_type:complete